MEPVHAQSAERRRRAASTHHVVCQAKEPQASSGRDVPEVDGEPSSSAGPCSCTGGPILQSFRGARRGKSRRTSRCRKGKKPEQASQRAVPRSKAWQHFHLCEKALANDCGEEGRGRGRGPRQEKTAAPPRRRRRRAFGGAFRGLDAAEENETQRLDVARCVLDVGHRGKEGHSVRDEKSERCTSLHACSDARAACACSGLCNC